MIELVIDARRKDLGGFEVGRVLPFHARPMVGPFIFLDQMGPAEFAPGADAINVRPHPHIGLSTLTYLFEGEIMHRDNLGYTQPIRPGEVNWMTAGSGIVHSERTDPLKKAQGGPMHGMQAWVALPTELEEIAPSFTHLGEDAQPTYENNGLFARLVAGEAFGAKAGTPVESPLFYVHWDMAEGVRVAPPPPTVLIRTVTVLSLTEASAAFATSTPWVFARAMMSVLTSSGSPSRASLSSSASCCDSFAPLTATVVST